MCEMDRSFFLSPNIPAIWLGTLWGCGLLDALEGEGEGVDVKSNYTQK